MTPQMKSAIETLQAVVHDYYEPVTIERAHEWINQFQEPFQLNILEELSHVLAKHYWPKEKMVEKTTELFSGLRHSFKNIFGIDFDSVFFFRTAPRNGDSEEMMHELMETFLQQQNIAPSMATCNGTTWVALDDAFYNGNGIRHRLIEVINNTQPGELENLVLIVPIVYTSAEKYFMKKMKEACSKKGAKFYLATLKSQKIKNRKRKWGTSQWEIYAPPVMTEIVSPESQLLINNYLVTQGLNEFPVFRPQTNLQAQIFSTARQRMTLEYNLLLKSIELYNQSFNPKETMRPNGYQVLPGLGFGSTLGFWRNWPNNAPLALWSETHNWTPLFPRKCWSPS